MGAGAGGESRVQGVLALEVVRGACSGQPPIQSLSIITSDNWVNLRVIKSCTS